MKTYQVIKDFKGSIDGMTVRNFETGQLVKDYEMGEDLLTVALREKWIKVTSRQTKRDKR